MHVDVKHVPHNSLLGKAKLFDRHMAVSHAAKQVTAMATM